MHYTVLLHSFLLDTEVEKGFHFHFHFTAMTGFQDYRIIHLCDKYYNNPLLNYNCLSSLHQNCKLPPQQR